MKIVSLRPAWATKQETTKKKNERKRQRQREGRE
jgi:hypothetical protein